ncbi:uncharacterized protein LOC143292110 [Babylonia areolata]|uniref:uncharacterized protein LOC143292110 n=1 Tax=Babylonia areolata TaxID=304850 RepID=UPI003FD13651
MTMAFRISYLFYVGIILPTVVTLALFVFFVICWRKQSARKAVLTKPYDPHGTMRRLGIPNHPPPPPVFLHHHHHHHPRGRGLITPTSELGGEDNAAYDMSRSPSAEASGGKGAVRPAHLPSSLCEGLESSVRQLQLLAASPSADLELSGRLVFHSRLDSGLSEPGHYESPGSLSQGGGGGRGGEGGGAGAGTAPRDRPQSQASHSSHSTDSEDSGFRSTRSGQLGHHHHHHHHHLAHHSSEPPVLLKRSRSAGRGGKGGRGHYQRAATSSPDSDTEPSLPLTPTALWSHPPSPEHRLYLGGEEGGVGKTAVDDVDCQFLQDLTSPGHNRVREKGGAVGGGGCGGLTCHQSMTMAQVHMSHDLDNPEALGFSVV